MTVPLQAICYDAPMCGRFTLTAPAETIRAHFGLAETEHAGVLEPRYNIAPSQEVPVVFQPEAGADHAMQFMRWGLVPRWAREARTAYSMINAKAETLADKPAYRMPFRRQRCLIPATGFYEWKALRTRKQPYYIHQYHDDLFAFAGLWEYWKGDAEIYSCTIITMPADDRIKSVHDRMPLIMSPAYYDRWLDCRVQDTNTLRAMLVSETADLECYPVSSLVNNAKQQGQALIEKIGR